MIGGFRNGGKDAFAYQMVSYRMCASGQSKNRNIVWVTPKVMDIFLDPLEKEITIIFL